MPGRIPRRITHEQLIRNAFEMQSNGNPAGMAETFAALAEQSEKDGCPRQAANLHAQSAHRWLDANEIEKAQVQADLSIAAFTKLDMEKRLLEFQTRFEVHKQNPGKPLQFNPASTSLQSKTLPAACPQCGAPVRSDEIEWIDQQSAECGYSGCILKTISLE
jgi:hypothetical protein